MRKSRPSKNKKPSALRSTRPAITSPSQPGAEKAQAAGSEGKSFGRAATQSAIVGLGIPGLAFGLGFAMIPLNFWAGVALMGGSLPIFWWLLFRVFHRNEKIKLYSGIILSLTISSALFWAIWVPASISPLLASERGNYSKGTMIFGIPWQEFYSELIAAIVNDTDYDFTNIDIYLRTDLTIADLGIPRGINSCTYEPYTPFFMAGGIIGAKNKNGETTDVPMLDKNKPIAANIYHVRCERISAHSEIEIRGAIEEKPIESTVKRQPKWAKIWVNLSAEYRSVHYTFQQCFLKPCGDIPSRYDDQKVPAGLYYPVPKPQQG
jgi:hypothetical protein